MRDVSEQTQVVADIKVYIKAYKPLYGTSVFEINAY